MKILTNNATFTYADIAKPTDYEQWERKDKLYTAIVDWVSTFASVIGAGAILVAIVILGTLM